MSQPKPSESTGEVCICVRWLSTRSHRSDTTTQAVNTLPKPPSSLSFFSSLHGNHGNTAFPAGLMFPMPRILFFYYIWVEFFFFPVCQNVVNYSLVIVKAASIVVEPNDPHVANLPVCSSRKTCIGPDAVCSLRCQRSHRKRCAAENATADQGSEEAGGVRHGWG